MRCGEKRVKENAEHIWKGRGYKHTFLSAFQCLGSQNVLEEM